MRRRCEEEPLKEDEEEGKECIMVIQFFLASLFLFELVENATTVRGRTFKGVAVAKAMGNRVNRLLD